MRISLEGAASHVSGELSVEFISTGTGDDVNNATHRSTVLGFVPRGFNLNLFDEFHEHALRGFTSVHAGGVHAVDKVHVLGTRGTVHHLTATDVLVVNSSSHVDDRSKIPPLGEFCDHLFSVVYSRSAFLDVNNRGLTDNSHFLFHCRLRYGDFKPEGSSQTDEDSFTDQCLESRKSEGDLVSSG